MMRARGAIEAIAARTAFMPFVVLHMRLGSIASFPVSTDLSVTLRATKRATGCKLQGRIEIEQGPFAEALHLTGGHAPLHLARIVTNHLELVDV